MQPWIVEYGTHEWWTALVPPLPETNRTSVVPINGQVRRDTPRMRCPQVLLRLSDIVATPPRTAGHRTAGHRVRT